MSPCHSCTPLEWTNDNQWVMLPCCLLHGECGLPINAMFIIIPPCSASLLGNRYIEIVPPKFQYQNTWVTPHLPTGKLKKMKKNTWLTIIVATTFHTMFAATISNHSWCLFWQLQPRGVWDPHGKDWGYPILKGILASTPWNNWFYRVGGPHDCNFIELVAPMIAIL